MKLDLITNATVVDDAIRFVSTNKTKCKSSDNSDEYANKEETNEPDHYQDEGQLEEEQEETLPILCTRPFFYLPSKQIGVEFLRSFDIV